MGFIISEYIQLLIMDRIWDLLSLTVFAIILAPVFLFLVTGEIHHLLILIGLLATDVVTRTIKYLTRNIKTLPYVFRRPSDASNCDIINKGGSCGGMPGMPSGHVATAAFFFTSEYQFVPKNMRISYVSIATCVVIAIGLSRYTKRCHSIPQIVCGAILGIGLGLLFRAIFLHFKRKISKNAR